MVIHGWRAIVDLVGRGGDGSGVLVRIKRNIRRIRIFINSYVFTSITKLN